MVLFSLCSGHFLLCPYFLLPRYLSVCTCVCVWLWTQDQGSLKSTRGEEGPSSLEHLCPSLYPGCLLPRLFLLVSSSPVRYISVVGSELGRRATVCREPAAIRNKDVEKDHQCAAQLCLCVMADSITTVWWRQHWITMKLLCNKARFKLFCRM